jgi:hypothetical protein
MVSFEGPQIRLLPPILSRSGRTIGGGCGYAAMTSRWCWAGMAAGTASRSVTTATPIPATAVHRHPSTIHFYTYILMTCNEFEGNCSWCTASPALHTVGKFGLQN